MLVYLKAPMGYTQIDCYRIYGKKFAYGRFGSTDIPRELYECNKDILEQAEYTPDWLEEKFNRKFPPISFKIRDLYKIDYKNLVKIARAVGINYIKNSKLSISEKKALCRSIAHKIS